MAAVLRSVMRGPQRRFENREGVRFCEERGAKHREMDMRLWLDQAEAELREVA